MFDMRKQFLCLDIKMVEDFQGTPYDPRVAVLGYDEILHQFDQNHGHYFVCRVVGGSTALYIVKHVIVIY